MIFVLVLSVGCLSFSTSSNSTSEHERMHTPSTRQCPLFWVRYALHTFDHSHPQNNPESAPATLNSYVECGHGQDVGETRHTWLIPTSCFVEWYCTWYIVLMGKHELAPCIYRMWSHTVGLPVAVYTAAYKLHYTVGRAYIVWHAE